MLLARHVSVEIHTYVRYMRGGESVGVGRTRGLAHCICSMNVITDSNLIIISKYDISLTSSSQISSWSESLVIANPSYVCIFVLYHSGRLVISPLCL